MPYTPPSAAELSERLSRLDKTTKSTRAKNVAFFIELAKKTQDLDIILGAVVFEAEKIAVEYATYGLDPRGGYLYDGADLFKELNDDILKNTAENSLDAETKIKYLLAYYRYRKFIEVTHDEPVNLSDDATEEYSVTEYKGAGPGPDLSLKSNIIKSVDAEFQPVQDFLIKQIPHLASILNARPDLDAMTKSLKTKCLTYETESKQRWKSTSLSNLKFLQLLKVLTHPFTDALIDAHFKDELEKRHFRYSVYFGAMLFMMKQIELSYEGFTTGVISTLTLGKYCTPEDSKVYELCQEVLNIPHSSAIPDAAKINLFVDFAHYIELAIKDMKTLSFLKSCKLKEGYYSSGPLGPTYFTDAQEYFASTYNQLENLVTQQSFIWSCTQSLGTYLAQTLLFMACLEVGAAVYAAGVGVNVLAPVFSRFGYRFLGGSLGAKVASQFAKAIEPGVMTNLYATGIWYGCKVLQDQVSPPQNIVYRAQQTSKQFAAELKADLEKPRTEPNELLIAILELPTSLISDKIKRRIHEIIILPFRSDNLRLEDGFDEEENPLFRYKAI